MIVFLVDTLRADRLGCYGYERPTSPHLDRFAADAVLFENAEAQSSWTKPAVASIFTGRHPIAHGANDWPDRLNDGQPTLAELFAAAGYDTAAFVSSAVVTRRFGFDRGFATFEQETKEAIEARETTSSWVVGRALDWLARRPDPARAPFLLYLHTLDPHAPYAPTAPFREKLAGRVPDLAIGRVDAILALGTEPPPPGRREALSDLYDAEIRGNDESFGRLIDALARGGHLDDTLLVFVSDHGEAFFEHRRWQHGNSLHAELVRVPLLVRFPGRHGAGTRVAAPVQQVDILPTLAAAAGLAEPAGIQGVDLARLVTRDGAAGDRAALAHLEFEGRSWRSLRLADHRLIVRRNPKSNRTRSSVYDLRRDPREEHDLAADDVELVRRLELRLEIENAALSAPPAGVPVPLDEESVRQLRALGYLSGGAPD